MGTHLITVPGFSSRSDIHIVSQFSQRDEAAMSEHEPEAGWSNSPAAKDAPEDVIPDVQTPDEVEPGFSNAKAVKAAEAEAEPAPKEEGDSETEKPAPAKKPAAKKSAAKKKG